MTTDRVLSAGDVTTMVNISRSTLYRKVRKGNFPRPIHLSAIRIGWLLSEVSGWLDERKSER